MSINKKDLLKLISRLIIGGIFIYTGWMKAASLPITMTFFHQLGIPGFLAYVVIFIEFVGGILVLLGLWLHQATLGLVLVMLGAIYYTHSAGFASVGLPLTTLSALLSLHASGPGAYTVRRLFKKD